MGHERLVDLVAADPHGARGDDPAEAEDGDVGRATPDVDDHRGAGLLDPQARADRGGHGLLDDVDPARARPQGGVLEGPPLHPGDVARHADDHARPDQPRRRDLLDEPADHPLGDVGVGDDPVPQRAHRGHRLRGAAEHLLGTVPGGQELAGTGAHRDDRRLVEHHPTATLVDDRVGRAEVDGEVPAPHPPGRPAAHVSRLGRRVRPAGCRAEVVAAGPLRDRGPTAAATQPRASMRVRDGRTLGWTDWGEADGIPLLRVPGTPGCRWSVRVDRTPWAERGCGW